jgi:glycine oxidase
MIKHPSVLIIGGGVIGCSIAYELSKKGILSTIIDKGDCNKEASIAAAGMLGAHVETHYPGPFFELCKTSRNLYRSWTDELYEISRISAQYIEQGILRVAITEGDEQELRSRLPWMGEHVEWLSEAEIRRFEPAVSEQIRGGLYFEQDHQVHPVYLANSLRTAIAKLGCTIIEQTPALKLITEGNRVVGARTANGDFLAEQTIIASGAWSPALLTGLDLTLPIVPIKGQSFDVTTDEPLIEKTVFTQGCYIVPKMDGSLLIGATQEAVGFNKTTTENATAALNQTAVNLIPELQNARFRSTWAGLRPGTPDGMPYIGTASDIPGLILAAGHFRNGILLAPITGKIVSQLVMNETLSVDIQPFSPDRVGSKASYS